MTRFTRQDAGLRREGQEAILRAILHRLDPAGMISPADNTRLQTLIANRAFRQPQVQALSATSEDFFVIPHMLRMAFAWPMTLTGTMALGLCLGLCVSAFTDTAPSVVYNVAMTGPWQNFMQ